MGDKSAISLLTSINGYLKTIVDDTHKNGQTKNKETQERMTQSLNKGPVLTGDAVKPKQETTKVGDIFLPAETIAALNTLPVIIMGLAKLKDKDIKNFTEALHKIKDAVDGLGKIKFSDKDAKTFELVTTSVSILVKADFAKVARNLRLANILGFNKLLSSTIHSLVTAVKNAGKINASDIKKLQTVEKTLGVFNGLIRGLGIVVGSVIALAVMIKAVGIGPILGATALTLALVTAYGAIAITLGVLSSKFKEAEKGVSSITSLTTTIGVLILGTLLIGAIAELAAPIIINGFVAISGVLLGYAAVFAVAAVVAELSDDMLKSSKSILAMGAVGMALVLGSLLVGIIAQESLGQILIGFAAITSVLFGYAALSSLIKPISQKTTGAITGLLLIMKVAGAAAALILASKLIGDIIWNDGVEGGAKLLIGLAAVGGVVIGIGELSRVIEKVATRKSMITSTKNMLLISAVALSAEAIILGAIGLSKLINEGDHANILFVLGACGTIIAAFGALAFAAGKFKTQIAAGIPALALVELIAAGSLLVLRGVLAIAERVKSVPDLKWGDIFVAIGAMATIVTAFGALSAAAGLAAPLILAGSASLAAVTGVAYATTRMMVSLVDMKKTVDELGDDPWGVLRTTISDLKNFLFIGDNSIKNLSNTTKTEIHLLGNGTLALSKVIRIVHKIANATKDIKLAADRVKGISVDEGTRPMKILSGIITELSESFKFGFGVKLAAIKLQSGNIRYVVSLTAEISKALSDISGVIGANNTIRAMIISSSGQVTYGKEVNPSDIASTLGKALKKFTDEMLNTLSDVDKSKARHSKKSLGIIVGMIEPVTKFANMLTLFETTDNDKLRKVRFDSNGNPIVTGEVDIVKVASSIAGAVTAFCSEIFSDKNKDKWKKISKQEKNASAAMGVFSTVIEPISGFIDALSKFSGDGSSEDVLSMPIYDDSGKLIYTRKINVKTVAIGIGSAVSTFITTLTEQSKSWIEQYAAADKGSLTVKGKNVLDTRTNVFKDAMGLFGVVLDPVVSFANVLSTFGNGNETTLVTYDSSGKERKVNVVAVTNTISTAITTLVTGLGTVFEGKKDTLESISKNQNAITDLLAKMTSSISEIGKVDSKNANATITAYSELINRLTTISVAPNTTEVSDTINKVLATLNTAVTGISTSGEVTSTGGIEGLNKKMNDSFLTVKSTLKDFDEVLDSGNKTRIKNIKDIADAIKEVNSESTKAKDNLGTVRDILEAIARITKASSSGELESVVNSLNSISIGSGRGSNGGGNTTVTITSDVIEQGVKDAILATLDDARIRTSHSVEEIKSANSRTGSMLNISSESSIELNEMHTL